MARLTQIRQPYLIVGRKRFIGSHQACKAETATDKHSKNSGSFVTQIVRCGKSQSLVSTKRDEFVK